MNKTETKSLEELKWLFEASTPSSIRKSIQTMLFAYIFEQERNGLDDDFKTNIENCQLLIGFFEKVVL